MKKKSKKPQMVDSPEQKMMRDNLLIPCQTKEHFQAWIYTYLAVDLVDCTVSRFSNINPLDAAWHLYEYAMFYSGYDPLRILFIASRSSQKTLLMAAIETAVLLHDKRDVLHFAAIETQASVCWGYVHNFFGRPYLRDLVVGKPTADQLKLKIPNILKPNEEPQEVVAKVLSITPASVQGQHAPFLAIDELLTLQYAKRRAFEDLAGVPDSDKVTGKPYIRAEISSRKGAFSLVEERISEAAETGLSIRTWNVLDVSRACPDSRSGTIPTTYFGSPSLGTVLTQANYNQISPSDQQKFYEAKGFDKCPSCPIASFCLSDLKNQKSNSRALKPIEKIISDYSANSIDWWLSQALSLMPSSEGLIYSKFKKERHVKTLLEVWHDLTGEHSALPVSFHQLVAKLHELKYKFYAGLDHTGGTGYAAVVITATSPDEKITYVLESWAETKLDIEDLMVHLNRLKSIYKFGQIYADPAWADKNRLLTKKGFNVKSNFQRDVDTGIEILRARLMAADGSIKLYFLDEKTKHIQNELTKYHYKENSDGSFASDPEESFNDACFSKDLEVLTKCGWKTIDTVNMNDIVCAVTSEGEESWSNPVKIINKFYSGKMHMIRHSHIEFTATNNHSHGIISQYNYKKKKKFILEKTTFDSLSSESYWLNNLNRWNHGNGLFEQGEKEAWFAGIWLAEGCFDTGNPTYILFDQKKKKNIEIIRHKLKEIGWHYTETLSKAGVVRFILSGQSERKNRWKSLFNEHSYDKKINFEDILKMTEKEKENLFDGYMLGDGCVTQSLWHFDSVSRKLVDSIQLISLMINIDCRIISYFSMKKEKKIIMGRECNARQSYRGHILTKNPVSNLKKNRFEIKKVTDEPVFCIETVTGYFLARQNGKVFVAGNCDALRYIFVNIFGKFGKVLAPELTKEDKEVIRKEMIGQESIEDWLQNKINETISKNLAETGGDPAEPEMGQNESGSLKWIL